MEKRETLCETCAHSGECEAESAVDDCSEVIREGGGPSMRLSVMDCTDYEAD